MATVNLVDDYGAVSGGSAAVNTAAVDAFNSANVRATVDLIIPPGTYDFDGGILGCGVAQSTVNAYGAELRGHLWYACFPPMQLYADTSLFLNSVRAGATSATPKTAEHISRVSVGDTCLLTSGDMQGSGSAPPNQFNWDYLTVASIVGTTIHFVERVQFNHPDTFPCYDPGLGTVTSPASPHLVSQGGPATLYILGSDWNTVFRLNGAKITPPAGLGMNAGGRDMTFYQCFGDEQGPVCSIAGSWRMISCRFPNCSLEVDKQVDYLELDDCDLGLIFMQSSSPMRARITNCRANGLNSGGRNLVTSDNHFWQVLVGMGGYGRTDSWLSTRDVISQVNHGGVFIEDVKSSYELLPGGTLKVPLYKGPQAGKLTGMFPGTTFAFAGQNEWQGNPFTVTDLRTDGKSVYAACTIAAGGDVLTCTAGQSPVDAGKPVAVEGAGPAGATLITTIASATANAITLGSKAGAALSGQIKSVAWGSVYVHTTGLGDTWPDLALTSGKLNLRQLPASNFKFNACTGCADAVDLSSAPIGKKLYEYSRRTYDATSWGDGRPKQLPTFMSWGHVISITLDVTKAYGGAQSKCTLSAPYRNEGSQVNLKVAGKRTIHPDGGVSNAQSGDSWSAAPTMWGTSWGPFLETDISGDDPSTWPEITITIDLDQGI